MKTTTYIKTLILALICIGSKTFGQTYAVYIAGSSTTITLKHNVTVNAGEQVVWVETTGGGSNTVQSGSSATYTTPSNLSVGEHSYRVHIISAAPASCTGDASPEYKIYKLSASPVTLSTPTNGGMYCENASSPSSAITATADAATPFPAGVSASYSYTWSATKDGNPAALNSVGTSTNASNTSTFTVNTTAFGVYKLQAQATPTYTIPSGVLRGTGEAATSGEATVTVSKKPDQPTIDVI